MPLVQLNDLHDRYASLAKILNPLNLDNYWETDHSMSFSSQRNQQENQAGTDVDVRA